MTIFELLARHQEEVEAAFRHIHGAHERKDHSAARAQFQTFATNLLACMQAEHAAVYPCFARDAGLEDEVRRALREHARIEQAVNYLRLVPLTPDAWLGALTRLQLLVSDHIETEEWILFPVARLRLGTEQATALAAEFTRRLALALPTTTCSISYDAPSPDEIRPAPARPRTRGATDVDPLIPRAA